MKQQEENSKLYNVFEEVYSHYVYRRVRDCWNRPICSSPGAEIVLKERLTEDNGWNFRFTGEMKKCINMASFNYLGLVTEVDVDGCIDAIQKYGWSTCSSSSEIGTTPLHTELEHVTAQFLGAEAVLLCGMGFATNAFNLPSILTKDCLVLSDARNHASIILGLKLSKATIRIYKHNDMEDLEEKLASAIVYEGKEWGKILIVAEGVYSMDGTFLNLPKMISLKKKYKAYLYIDDAHGVGVLGQYGKGIFDYWNCSIDDIDILMGTYSKAFASNGGFIAGKETTIRYIRRNSYTSTYATTISPVVAQQAISSIKKLMAYQTVQRGNVLLNQLKENTQYFRKSLKQMGLAVCGNSDSHVVPWILFSISAVCLVVRELKKEGIAVAGVAYPATPLFLARIRFNISAAHTRQQLDYVLNCIHRLTKEYGLNQKPVARSS